MKKLSGPSPMNPDISLGLRGTITSIMCVIAIMGTLLGVADMGYRASVKNNHTDAVLWCDHIIAQQATSPIWNDEQIQIIVAVKENPEKYPTYVKVFSENYRRLQEGLQREDEKYPFRKYPPQTFY